MKRRKPIAERRARSALGWFLIGIATIGIGFSVALETRRPEWRDPEYGHKLHLLRRHRAEALVVLGSSRVLNGLRPSVLASGALPSFNFGLTRHGPVVQHLALERLFRDGVRPRAVVLEVFPAALPVGIHEFDSVPAFRHTVSDVVNTVRRGEQSLHVAEDWLEARALPCYAHRFVLMSHWCPNWVAWDKRQDYAWTAGDDDGWLPAPVPRDAGHASELRTAMAGTEGAALAAFRIDPAADHALRASLQLCQSKGTPVAVLLMPEASWYRAFLAADGEKALYAYASGLGVPLIDARGWCEDVDFRDGAHLIGRGVDTFSARFGREIALMFP